MSSGGKYETEQGKKGENFKEKGRKRKDQWLFILQAQITAKRGPNKSSTGA
jgi:hypothetical protein